MNPEITARTTPARGAGALIARSIARALFASRWLLAPFYAGLIVALGGLLIIFGRELWDEVSHVMTMKPETGVLMALSLIDLSLAANLVVIVMLAGYENFVARMSVIDPAARPDWMGKVDFSGLKIRVIASIVAIATVALLRAYMEYLEPDTTLTPTKLFWLIALVLTFVVCGVLMALMDWLAAHAERLEAGHWAGRDAP